MIDSTRKPQSSRHWLRRLTQSRGFLAIVGFVVAGSLLVVWVDSIGGVQAFHDQFGSWAVFVIIPVQAVVAVSPFPSELLALGTSALYGFWGGALLAWCGWFLAAFLQYFVVQRTARDYDFDQARKRFPRWLRELPADHPAFLIFGRWLPFGPHIVNSAAGAYGVPLFRHAWCAGLSIIVPALLISAFANGLLNY